MPNVSSDNAYLGADPSEFRFKVDLLLRVFGMDADSHPFSQNAHVPNISDQGAQLSGLERQLKPGDIIGVQFGNMKARCKVIWARDAGPARKTEAGVKLVKGQLCPWREEIERQRTMPASPIPRIVPAEKDKRKFRRLRIPFPMEIRDALNIGTHLQASTHDIAGSGCYVETLQPFPVRKLVDITFWLNSRRIQTHAMVRTCDGGVGMGIEFIGLDEVTQNQLQEQLEILAEESGLFKQTHGTF
jgi:PilZ domain